MRTVPSITDVAKQAGVTKATVSRALRNREGVSEETRHRILEIARKLDYWPSPVHQGPGRVHTGRVGFLAISEDMPRIANEAGSSYLHGLMEGCRSAAEEQGKGLMICRMTWEQVHQQALPAAIRMGHLDGLVLRGWWFAELHDMLEELELPCVMVDCDRMVTGMPQVQVENIQAMEQAVAHVVENGGKQVAVITGDMEHLNSQERLAGLQMALTRRQLALPDSHIIQEHGYNEASGIRGVEQLLKRNVPFDTLFCQNDLIALGAIRKLVSLGHCIPHTVKVVGFDNMEFADMPEIGLTTVDAHPHKLGEVSMRLLLDMLSGKHTDNVHLRVGSELIVRQTTVCRTMEKQYV